MFRMRNPPYALTLSNARFWISSPMGKNLCVGSQVRLIVPYDLMLIYFSLPRFFETI